MISKQKLGNWIINIKLSTSQKSGPNTKTYLVIYVHFWEQTLPFWPRVPWCSFGAQRWVKVNRSHDTVVLRGFENKSEYVTSSKRENQTKLKISSFFATIQTFDLFRHGYLKSNFSPCVLDNLAWKHVYRPCFADDNFVEAQRWHETWRTQCRYFFHSYFQNAKRFSEINT